MTETAHRILYVSDPSTIARTVLPDPVREADLRQWVDMVADSGIDMFNQEIFSQGWTAYWQSEHYEYDQRPQHQRFRPLIEAGTQPLDILIDQSHRRGMQFIAGFRMDELNVRLNDHAIPDEAIGRTASSDRVTTVDSTREKDGRNIPCTAQGGRIEFRALSEKPVFSTRWFALSDPLVERGNNYLSITLTKSDPEAASSTIVIGEVEIFVEPR